MKGFPEWCWDIKYIGHVWKSERRTDQKWNLFLLNENLSQWRWFLSGQSKDTEIFSRLHQEKTGSLPLPCLISWRDRCRISGLLSPSLGEKISCFRLGRIPAALPLIVTRTLVNQKQNVPCYPSERSNRAEGSTWPSLLVIPFPDF